MPYPWAPGDDVDAAGLNAIAGEWVDDLAFTIGATTTPPTKGVGTIYVVRYRLSGTVDLKISVAIGAGWASGTGDYTFPLPVAARAVEQDIGAVWVFDSGTGFKTGAITVAGDTSHARIILDGAAGWLGSAGPGTAWAPGDKIAAELRYEPA